jgi:hypothetical protein
MEEPDDEIDTEVMKIILMRDLYHCPPSLLPDEDTMEIHRSFLHAQNSAHKNSDLTQKRIQNLQKK